MIMVVKFICGGNQSSRYQETTVDLPIVNDKL
jgi:hypothetical protein